MKIIDFAKRNAILFPDKTAFIYGKSRCTFKEFNNRVNSLANGLLNLGVKKGDRVAVMANNCFEYPELYFGIGKTGAIATMLNFRLIGSEIAYLLNDAEANTLIIQKDYIEMTEAIRKDMGTVKNFICIEGKPEKMLDYNQFLESSSKDDPEIEIDMEDLFCLLYTGGTTGRPKGVMLTHRNLHSNSMIMMTELRLKASDSGIIVTPLFHTGSCWPLFTCFMRGNTQVIMKQFEIKELLETIEREKITFCLWLAAIVPQILGYPNLKNLA